MTKAASEWLVDRRADTTLVVAPGASAMAPADWPGLLAQALQRHGPLAVVVAKRVTPGGTLAAMGEMVVHPKGLHGVGRGVLASAYRFPEEVDGTVTGAAIFPSRIVADLPAPQGGFGLLAWCLEARLRGARVFAVPDVVHIADDTPLSLTNDDLYHFFDRFRFHPFSPDIDEIAARTELAPLRWNARYFGTAQPFEKYAERGAFHWKAYAEHEPFRRRAEFLVGLAAESFAASDADGDVLDVGCGDGLYATKLAERGFAVTGIDDDEPAIRISLEESQRAAPARAPYFSRGSVYALPAGDASARGAILFDVIEHLHNPARALRELARVIAPGGALVIATPEWQFGASSDPTYHLCEFTLDELQRIVSADGLFRVERNAKIGGVYRDLVVVARRA